MKLSIITVNRNNRDGLQKTIDSVVGQTFRDFEWIIIDGGSTDGSKELIEKYADHFAYWVSEPDKGIYNAMNKGIKVTKGDYLFFLNSGDRLWNHQTLDIVFEHDSSYDIIYGDAVFSSDSTLLKKTYPDKITSSFFMDDNLCHQSTFIKKEFFIGNPYNESFPICADYNFFVRVFLINGCSSRHIPIIISEFEANGISNNVDAVTQERNRCLEILFSNTLIDDLQHLLLLENIEKSSLWRKVKIISKNRTVFKIYKIITTMFVYLSKIYLKRKVNS